MQGKDFELGIYTFAELTPDPDTGRVVSPAERLRDLLEEIELADQVGLDVFGVGEHHRPDFAVSAPAVVLAAAAERTERIRLTSAVSRAQLGRPGPRLPGLRDARPALRRACRDHGRPRLVHRVVPALRATTSHDYDELFAEKLDLLLAVREHERVTWTGGHRAAARGSRRLSAARSRTRCRSGSRSAAHPSRRSARARSGCRWRWAIIGGLPERFAPFAELHRARGARGRARPPPALSINSHGFIAETARSKPPTSVFRAVRDDDGPDRARAGLAADDPRSSSRRRARSAARTSSAARRRSSRRSSSSTRSSGTSASCSSSRVGTIPHAELMRRSSCSGRRSRPVVRAELSRRAETPAPVA